MNSWIVAVLTIPFPDPSSMAVDIDTEKFVISLRWQLDVAVRITLVVPLSVLAWIDSTSGSLRCGHRHREQLMNFCDLLDTCAATNRISSNMVDQ